MVIYKLDLYFIAQIEYNTIEITHQFFNFDKLLKDLLSSKVFYGLLKTGAL